MFAYVQIAVDGTKEQSIYTEVKKFDQVREVHILFGEWDMMIKLELTSPEELAAFVMENIRPIEGVRLTSTMIVAR